MNDEARKLLLLTSLEYIYLFIIFTTETVHVKHVTIQYENYHATAYKKKN